MDQMQVKSFLKNHIDLDKERYISINEKYKKIKELIESKMSGFVVKKQGSMATKTAIRPKNIEDEYDLDIAITKNNISNPEDFLFYKDELEIIMKNHYKNVLRKDKCINIVWNKQFNGDLIIMNNQDNHQQIMDEKYLNIIESDNLNLISIINEKFASSENDALRDASKLIKFYLRQHSDTKGLISSISINLLLVSNAASKSLGYIGQVSTTISNIANYLLDIRNENKLLAGTINPSNKSLIKTKISKRDEMKNVILVLQDLVIDVSSNNSSLRALKFDSDIRSSNINTIISEKPWKIF